MGSRWDVLPQSSILQSVSPSTPQRSPLDVARLIAVNPTRTTRRFQGWTVSVYRENSTKASKTLLSGFVFLCAPPFVALDFPDVSMMEPTEED